MESSGVAFGTSGARGTVAAMSNALCRAYTAGFLHYLSEQGELPPSGGEVALAGDLRSSTPRIANAVAAEIIALGHHPIDCGEIPTPALTLYAMQRGIPSIMITGSHIPETMNGIKFNKPSGEILKADEAGIRRQRVVLREECYPPLALPRTRDAERNYLQRYLDFYPSDLLRGRRIGVYQNSSVARILLVEVLSALGATVIPLGYSCDFLSVDTEALRPEQLDAARQWVADYQLDSLVSTDGDGDRPLLSDEQGNWLRGDLVGILCARHLGCRVVATPVSSNSAVERSGWFDQVRRTRIGSPYVIEAMQQALDEGQRYVAGYEANGGFLLADSVVRAGRTLAPLPTRDALLPILALLAETVTAPISRLSASLPARYTYSDRLVEFPVAQSQHYLATLRDGSLAQRQQQFHTLFGQTLGKVVAFDYTDGVRITLDNERILHLRPSGNAPELRCYSEAESAEQAALLNRAGMEKMAGWLTDAAR